MGYKNNPLHLFYKIEGVINTAFRLFPFIGRIEIDLTMCGLFLPNENI